ncbi:MAG: 50S ribosomal protein L33 [candidate division WOR-3 bacterium]
MRELFFLACSVCKRRNYRITKSKDKKMVKMETKKYCKWCKKHTVHKETKIK